MSGKLTSDPDRDQHPKKLGAGWAKKACFFDDLGAALETIGLMAISQKQLVLDGPTLAAILEVFNLPLGTFLLILKTYSGHLWRTITDFEFAFFAARQKT